MNAIYVLLPSLLPLAATLQGMKIDYAAHFGGAFGGVAAGTGSARTLARRRRPAAPAHCRDRDRTSWDLRDFVGAGALAQRNYPVWAVHAAFAPQDGAPGH